MRICHKRRSACRCLDHGARLGAWSKTGNQKSEAAAGGIGKALGVGDSISFGRLAHSIKSSSASLGALTFSQQARELEMLGKANDLAGVGSKLNKLAADFSLVTGRLEELKNES